MKAFLPIAARILIVLGLTTALAPALAGQTPPALDGNVPCKVKQKVSAVYPHRMLSEGVLHGEALIVIQVAHTGQLRDALIVAHTHRAFADAAMAAIRQWEFIPASRGEQTLPSRIDITFLFEVTGIVVYEKKPFELYRRIFDDERFGYRPHRSAELDEPIKTLHQPAPIYPKQWIAEGRRGAVLIDFFVDETGGVRLAAPADRGDEWLTAAALAAVDEWKFVPPRRRGAPVLVRAQQLFVFQPPADAS